MTPTATATDQDLVLATRRGEDRAYEELYARYRKRIAGYCHRLLSDHDRADDIAQDVFISALRRLRETDRPIVFRPWIYEIARNACIDEYRRRGRHHEVPIERDGELVWTGRSAPPPEVVVESKQAIDDLRGAFRGLSDRHHQIIVLRELEGMSYSQIGDRLGMSKMVVESTLFRARRRLSEEYEDLSSGRRCEHVLGLIGAGVPKRLGLRERRALASHLEHCQSCRREARARDLALVERLDRLPRRGVAGKVAALLPVPLVRLPWRFGARVSGSARAALQAAGSAASSAAGYSDTVMAVVGSGRAAAAAVTLLAAVGGGVATTDLAGGATGGRGSVAATAHVRGAEVGGAATAAAAGAGRPGQLGLGGAGRSADVTPGRSLAAGGWAAGRRTPASGRVADAPSASGAIGSGAAGAGAAGHAGAAASSGTGSASQVAGAASGITSSATSVSASSSTDGFAAPVSGAGGAAGGTSTTVDGAVGHVLSGASSSSGSAVSGTTSATTTSPGGSGDLPSTGAGSVAAPTGSPASSALPSTSGVVPPLS
jgi:RNA polymerase sigma factor (sigma-70 family)